MPTLQQRRLLLDNPQFDPSKLPNLVLRLDASIPGSVLTGGASQFVAASSQYLSIADNAALSTGDVDFWFSGWWNLSAFGVTGQTLLSKWGGLASGLEEYLLYYPGLGKVGFYVSATGGDGGTPVEVAANPSAAAFHHYFCWHDSVANTINISVDVGTPVTVSFSGGTIDGAAAFQIGKDQTSNYLNGLSANVAFGKSPPGGFATTPATTIRDTLYNSGAGVDLRTIDSATKTAWGAVSAWPMNEPAGGARSDVWSTNHLTNNNSVSGADGPYTYAAQDGDAARMWRDLSSAANHASQATGVKKPLYKTGGLNNLPYLRFDGVDDIMTTLASSFSATSASRATIFAIVVPQSNPGASDIRYVERLSTLNQYELGLARARASGGNLMGALAGKAGITSQQSDDSATTLTGVPRLVMGVWDGTNVIYYRDGSLRSSTVLNATVQGATANSGVWTLGAQNYNGSDSDWSQVDLVELGIVSRDLSANEIAKVFAYASRKSAVVLS